jgi:hypothetical protein
MWKVDKIRDRQMEGDAGVDELDQVVEGGGVERTADNVGAIDHHAHRISVEAGKRGNQGSTEKRRNLEDRIEVHYEFEYPARFGSLAAVVGMKASRSGSR